MADRKFPGFCEWRLCYRAEDQIDGRMPKCGPPYPNFVEHYAAHYVDTTEGEYYLRILKQQQYKRSVAILSKDKINESDKVIVQGELADVVTDAVRTGLPIYICECVVRQEEITKILYRGKEGCSWQIVDPLKRPER